MSEIDCEVVNSQTVISVGCQIDSEDTVACNIANGVTDHRYLTGKDSAGQHPISAITNLQASLDSKADASTTYTKTEVDTSLNLKADKSTTYTKTEVDTSLNLKADKATTYTKTEVDTALSNKQNTLTAGNNITISNDTISATDTTYTAGTGISIENNVIANTKSNYEDFTDKPTINSVTLTGNKTTTNLKVGVDQFVSYICDSTNNLPVYISRANGALVLHQYSGTGAYGFYKATANGWEYDTDRNVTIYKGMIVQADSGELYICTNYTGTTWAFAKVTDNDKVDDVKVNNSSVVVDRVAYVTVPTKSSELTNDSGYITNSVSDLTNYTKTTDLGDLALKDTVDYSTEVTNKPTIPSVINNTTTEDVSNALSANMGKELQTEINNLKNIGRFLAIWNATTGVPTSEPTTSPYTYKTGDYFRVGVVGDRIPTGTQYVIGGTNYTTTTDTLTVGDVYYYDGTTWNRQASSGGGTVQDVQVNGTSVLSGGIANVPVASSSDLGVIKTADSSATTVSSGVLQAQTKSVSEYSALANSAFVGKGTLENALTSKSYQPISARVNVMNSSTGNYPSCYATTAYAIQKNAVGNTTQLVEPRVNSGGITITEKGLVDMSYANHFFGIPGDHIVIETTTDAGATWVDAGYTDTQKASLFNQLRNQTFTIPLKNGVRSTDCAIRVTITASNYTVPEGTAETEKESYWRQANYVSTERYLTVRTGYCWLNGTVDRIRLTIDARLDTATADWVNLLDQATGMRGWSGANSFDLGADRSFGGTHSAGHYQVWRFTFRTCASDGTYDDSKLSTQYPTSQQNIAEVRAYGDSIWTKPNNMAYNNHLYRWDKDLNVYFPLSIYVYQNNEYHTVATTTDLTAKEDTSNKSSSYTESSTTTYPNTKALVDGLATKQDTLTGLTATVTELNNTSGTTSNIQTQLDSKVSDVQLDGTSIVSSGVANIPHATTSSLGVIKVSNSTGTSYTSSGVIVASTRTYANYTNGSDSTIIGKGTLENVITGKNLETADNKVTSISSSSTDTQYPSAKCVYDLVGNIESTLQAIRGV